MLNIFQTFLETNRRRLPLLIPVALGAGTAWYYDLLREPLMWHAASGALFCMVLAYIFRRKTMLLMAFILLAAMSVGFLNAAWHTARLHAPVLAEPLFARQVSGHVEAVELDEGSIKVTLGALSIEKLEAQKTPKKIRLTLKKKPEPALEVGDDITIKATLFPLPEPVAPGAFDFGRFLYFQGLGAVGFSVAMPEVTNHRATSGNAIDQFRLDFANDMLEHMRPPYGAVSAALTVGEQKAVPEEVNDVLRDSGLYHILSISGLHMAIAAGLVFFVIRFLLALSPFLALRYPIKKIAAVTALLASFFYLLAAGSPVPAVRSFLMVSVVFTAILCDRKGISMVSLGWAALLVLLVQPSAVVSASFQLSFAATAAIIALYEHYGSRLYHPTATIARRMITAICATIIISLTATLATAPFVITHFNRLQLWGMLANALVSPLTAFLIMPAVVVSFILWPLGLQHLAYVPLEYGVQAMLWIGYIVAKIPYASIFLPSLTPWGFALACLGFCWFVIMHGRWRMAGLFVLLLGFGSMAFQTSADVFIAQKGKLIAVKDAMGNLVMVKGGDKSFTAEQWAKSNGQKVVLAADAGMWNDRVALECDKQSCTYKHGGVTTLFIFNPRGTKALCESVGPDILVFNFYVRRGECEDVTYILNRDALTDKGAVDIRFDDITPIIRYARDLQGNRPWVAPQIP